MVQEPIESVMGLHPSCWSSRGTTQNTPRVKVLSPAPTIGRESPSRCNTFSTRPGSNKSWTAGRELERSPRERPVRDDRGVEVPFELAAGAVARERPDERRQRRDSTRASRRPRPARCCGHAPAPT